MSETITAQPHTPADAEPQTFDSWWESKTELHDALDQEEIARQAWEARQKRDVAIANSHADPDDDNVQWRMCAEQVAKEIEEDK